MEGVRRKVVKKGVKKGIKQVIKKATGGNPITGAVLVASGAVYRREDSIQQSLEKSAEPYQGQDAYSTNVRDGFLEAQGMVAAAALPAKIIDKAPLCR